MKDITLYDINLMLSCIKDGTVAFGTYYYYRNYYFSYFEEPDYDRLCEKGLCEKAEAHAYGECGTSYRLTVQGFNMLAQMLRLIGINSIKAKKGTE